MKVLVTAEQIVDLQRSGKSSLEIVPQRTIVTPEARDVAKKLGINICESGNADISSSVGKLAASADTVNEIRRAVEAKLPAGKHDPALLEQLVKKAMQEMLADGPSADCDRDTSPSGVVLVRGSSVKFGTFDGAPGKSIGLSDVIGAQDKSPIAAGFMQWKNASFPWTLTYDEIDIVLEGELHIQCDGNTYIGKPGDVFYIPKNTAIEFATPSNVRFVYVTYPADWAGEKVSG